MGFRLNVKTVFGVLITICLLLVGNLIYAQDCEDPLNPNPDRGCDADTEVPLDDRVYLLLIAGILIGYTKLKQRKKEM